MTSLSITAHCSHNDDVTEHYITLHTEWCRHWALHHTAHRMMSSLSITSHSTQTDVVIDHYITLLTEWCRHWALHHTAHRMMSSLTITLLTDWCRHWALHHTARRKRSPLALLISHVHVVLALHQPCARRINIASAIHTSFNIASAMCTMWRRHWMLHQPWTCCWVAMRCMYTIYTPGGFVWKKWGEARRTVTVLFVDRRVYVSMYHPVQKDKEI